MSHSPPRLAAALAAHYRLERELGQGGMATVYLAHDLRHERKVAVKQGYAVFPVATELLLVKNPPLEDRRRGAVTLMVNWRPGRGGATNDP